MDGKVYVLNTTKDPKKFNKVDDPDKLKTYKIDELLSGGKMGVLETSPPK